MERIIRIIHPNAINYEFYRNDDICNYSMNFQLFFFRPHLSYQSTYSQQMYKWIFFFKWRVQSLRQKSNKKKIHPTKEKERERKKYKWEEWKKKSSIRTKYHQFRILHLKNRKKTGNKKKPKIVFELYINVTYWISTIYFIISRIQMTEVLLFSKIRG